jgi:hypothetical protein
MPACLLFALVVLFVLPLRAVGDDVPPALRVADVKATVGDWIVLRADTDGRIVRWKAVDRGIRIAPPELALRDPKVTLASASRPGKYRVVCVTARGDVPSDIIEFTVTVEADGPDPTPPTPPIPNPPSPPEPVDPLVKAVRDAFTSEPGDSAKKREYANTLAGFYAAMARHVSTDQVATVGDLLSDYRAAIPTLLPDGAVPATRQACGQAVAALAGADADKAIDASLKSKLVDLFTRLSAALAALPGK